MRQTAERLDADKKGVGSQGILSDKGKSIELLHRASAGQNPEPQPVRGATLGEVRSAMIQHYRLGEQFVVDFVPRRHSYMVDGRPVQASLVCPIVIVSECLPHLVS